MDRQQYDIPRHDYRPGSLMKAAAWRNWLMSRKIAHSGFAIAGDRRPGHLYHSVSRITARSQADHVGALRRSHPADPPFPAGILTLRSRWRSQRRAALEVSRSIARCSVNGSALGVGRCRARLDQDDLAESAARFVTFHPVALSASQSLISVIKPTRRPP